MGKFPILQTVNGSRLVNCDAMMVSWLQLVSRHVIEVQEIGFKMFGTELRRSWPPADSSCFCTFLMLTTVTPKAKNVSNSEGKFTEPYPYIPLWEALWRH